MRCYVLRGGESLLRIATARPTGEGFGVAGIKTRALPFGVSLDAPARLVCWFFYRNQRAAILVSPTQHNSAALVIAQVGFDIGR